MLGCWLTYFVGRPEFGKVILFFGPANKPTLLCFYNMSSEFAELVFVETPYSNDIDRNVRYLMLCGFDAATRHELGVNTHGSMTQHPCCPTYFVPDNSQKWNVLTREGAINLGQALRVAAKKTVFYEDLGWSTGMKAGLERQARLALRGSQTRRAQSLVVQVRTHYASFHRRLAFRQGLLVAPCYKVSLNANTYYMC